MHHEVVMDGMGVGAKVDIGSVPGQLEAGVFVIVAKLAAQPVASCCCRARNCAAKPVAIEALALPDGFVTVSDVKKLPPTPPPTSHFCASAAGAKASGTQHRNEYNRAFS